MTRRLAGGEGRTRRIADPGESGGPSILRATDSTLALGATFPDARLVGEWPLLNIFAGQVGDPAVVHVQT